MTSTQAPSTPTPYWVGRQVMFLWGPWTLTGRVEMTHSDWSLVQVHQYGYDTVSGRVLTDRWDLPGVIGRQLPLAHENLATTGPVSLDKS